LGVDLLELDLMRSNGLTVTVEDEKTGAGGSLVDSTDKDFAWRRHVAKGMERRR